MLLLQDKDNMLSQYLLDHQLNEDHHQEPIVEGLSVTRRTALAFSLSTGKHQQEDAR